MTNYLKSYKWFIVLALVFQLTGCGINTIPTLDEQVKANWAQVENNYQRRADLSPILLQRLKAMPLMKKKH